MENNETTKVPDDIFEQMRAKRVQKAIEAGFTESQARFLTEELTKSSMGFGVLF